MIPVHGVILAAGSSRRLGQPKQLVTVGVPSETLLARTARVLREGGVTTLRVVVGAPDLAIDAEAERTGARILRSADPGEGSAASVRAATLDASEREREPYALLFAVVDQIALTPAHVTALVRAFAGAGGMSPVGSSYAGALGVPAIFPARLVPALLAVRGDAGARTVLRDDPSAVEVPFPGGERDVDVPEDLAR